MGLSVLFIIHWIVISASAESKGTPTKTQKENCFVTVKSIRKSDEVSERTFAYFTDSKATCEDLARPHRTNFAPRSIRSVIVRVDFDPKTKETK